MARRPLAETLPLLAALALFGTLLFRHLSYPLLWQDEAETAMFATRILAYGYPKVHGPRNVLYEFGPDVALGVKERHDAYIGTTWGQFYFAVPGVWWAGAARDPYVRTLRVRLPFAAAGALGMGLFALAALPALAGDPRAARRFATLFFLLASVSVSLQLHLREARYYPLSVLLAACILALHLRRAVFGSLSAARYGAALALLLVLLFHTFYSAYLAFLALLALEAGRAGLRGSGAPAARRRRALADLAPLAASAVLLLPSFAYFETFRVAAGFASHVGLTAGGYAANLGSVAAHFLRHELLAPALASRVALSVTERALRRRSLGLDLAPARDASRLLGRFAVGYALLGCLNPLAYERYFVLLSPVVSLVFLLDAFALARLAPRLVAPPRARAARRTALAALGALVALSVGVRAPELAGRARELARPYRGPLDFAIEFLTDRYPRPGELVIATNYAAHVYMYYLGSRVIVGLSLNNIARERELEPDVVIPRRGWRPGRAELERFLRRGRYERHLLPVEDRHFNNVAALSRTRWLPDPHRFLTPATHDPEDQLAVYLRVGPR